MRAIPRDSREHIVDDLNEVYFRFCRDKGAARARRWYWREALVFSAAFLLERLRYRTTSRHLIEVPNENKRGPMRRTFEAWTTDFVHAARRLVRAPVPPVAGPYAARACVALRDAPLSMPATSSET